MRDAVRLEHFSMGPIELQGLYDGLARTPNNTMRLLQVFIKKQQPRNIVVSKVLSIGQCMDSAVKA